MHLAYLAEACCIEPWLRAAGIEHLHAHFGTNSAEVAMLVHALGGPQWSFTVHGPEEFDNAQVHRLGGESSALCVRGSHQLVWAQPTLPLGGAPALAQGAGGTLRAGACLFRNVRVALSPTGAAPRLRGPAMRAKRAVAAGGGRASPCSAGGGVRAGAGRRRRAARRYRGLDQSATSCRTECALRAGSAASRCANEILAARALVLPSFAEGLPVVIMEAMALRRPVISTFVAGIPELVQSGRTRLAGAGRRRRGVGARHAGLSRAPPTRWCAWERPRIIV